MTEFNVTAVFLLVPLFIMIPLLGKYIDMKHASVQAARYMAWERTVWFEPSTVPNERLYPSKKKSVNARVKEHKVLVKETRDRFFSGVNIDALAGSDNLNLLWNDRGNPILKSQADVKLEFVKGGNEQVGGGSVFYTAIKIFSDIVGNVASIFGTALNAGKVLWNKIAGALKPIPFPTFKNVNGLFSNVMDNYQFKGYYHAQVTMKIDDKLFDRMFDPEGKVIKVGPPLDFGSEAAVLTDSWVVGDDKQFMAFTKTFVPFSPLQEFWEPIRDIVTWKDPIFGLSVAPEMKGLEMGYVDVAPLTDSSIAPNCSKGGLCTY